MSWARFASSAPELAEAGRRLLYRDGVGRGLLATVRDGEPPRIHPVSVAVIDGQLLTFISRSAKRADLELDGRYALHAYIDPAAPSEFSVRGHAIPIDSGVRDEVAAGWHFDPADRYRLFELLVESAQHGLRPDPEAWPPVFTRWTSQPTD